MLQFKAIKLLLCFCLLLLVYNGFAQEPFISYNTPDNYQLNTPITPLIPFNNPGGGPVPATIYGQVSSAPSAFGAPKALAVDANGNVFVADWDNNQIKEINTTGTITVFAGSGSQGAANGQGTAASFYEPAGIVIDANGNLYVSDQGNNLIRKITPGGLVSTFAGSGTIGAVNGTGTNASFNSPAGLAIDPLGNIYVADQANNLIRKITAAGVVTTYVGNGTSGLTNGSGNTASFNSPTGLGMDALGNLYVADAGNNVIRKITQAGVVSTFATGFNSPREVKADGTGNLYVTDQDSNTIKRVSPAGVVTTIAGTGQAGSTDGNGNVATFNGPVGLVLDGKGNLFLGDSGNNLVRKIIVSGYTIDKSLPPGLSFDSATGIISGTPTALSPATTYVITAYNGSGSSSVSVVLSVGSTLLPSIITFHKETAPPVNNNVTPNVTSTNTGTPITYTSSNPAVAIITADGLIHLVGPGKTTITASQSASDKYDAGAATELYTVTTDEVLSMPSISPKTTCDINFSAGASSTNPTIQLIYSSSNPAVATISELGIIHIVGAAGSTTITVSQAGNAFYAPATSVSQSFDVTIPPVPFVSIAPNSYNVCTGMPVVFTATVRNVGENPTYQWQVNGQNAGTNNAVFTISALNPTDVVTCIVTNSGTCALTGTSAPVTGITTIPFVTPSISIQSSATGAICSGNNISFTAVAINGGSSPTYQWQVNGVNSGTNAAIFSSSTLADGDNVACILTNNGELCLASSTALSNTITVNVTTATIATINITASVNNVYAGIPITFTATSSSAVANYQWQVNGVNVGSNNATFTSTTLKTGDAVTCIILSTDACAVPLTSPAIIMTIMPPPTVHITNTFTPNGDGANDLWEIPDLAYYPNCVVNIYNRYGTMLYQSKGYSKAWDGFYNGKELPAGTYYYIVNLNNAINTAKYSGYITIIR